MSVKRKYQSTATFDPGVWPGERITEKSKTNPRGAYTVGELIARYRKGQPLPINQRQPFFNEEYILPQRGDRDFVDIDMARESLENRDKELKTKITDERKALAEKRKEFLKSEIRKEDDEKARKATDSPE